MKPKYLLLNAAFASLLFAGPLQQGALAKEPAHSDAAPAVSPTEALSRLKAGNARFASGELQHPRQGTHRREELANGQHPFAVVLGCADSRTSPEVLFDQGLGDLFVVRVAGNIADDGGIGSIEYAVEHLGARLIVVLGHERCGAVKAARDTIAAKTEAPGHLKALVKAIAPAVKATAGKDAEATAHANEQLVAQQLRTSKPVLKDLVAEGKIAVVAAHYDLDSGKVVFLKENPTK